MFLAALAMQIETLHQAVNNWWRPADGTLRQAWSALSAWSTWPVGVLYTGIGLIVVLVVVVAALLTRAGIVSRVDAEDAAATPVRGAEAAAPPSAGSEPVSSPDGPRHARDVLPPAQPPADSSPPAAH